MSDDLPLDQSCNSESEKSSDQHEIKQPWKISKRGLLVFVTICVLTLMVALDSTSIGVVLPVSPMTPKALLEDLSWTY